MKKLQLDFRFDPDLVLAPISPGHPEGDDLRFDSIYDKLRDLRKEDDATLPQGVWKTDLKRADWAGMETLCLQVLETRSKDLQVAAWLLEAWIHLHGFAGGAEGFNLILALCNQFWEVMYPQFLDGDKEFRIAPLVWIDRKLAIDLKTQPLTIPDSDEIPRYSWADWEKACQPERPGQPGPPEAITIPKFQQSVLLTPTEQLRGLQGVLGRLSESCQRLEDFLDEKLGRDAPGLTATRATVHSIAGLLASAIDHRPLPPGITEGSGQEMDGSVPNERIADNSLESSRQGPEAFPYSGIQTRGEAYALLSEAADFLARTEPHSPTPYLVRRAVLWGSMPLDELLPELVRNPGELSEISRLLNIRDATASKK